MGTVAEDAAAELVLLPVAGAVRRRAAANLGGRRDPARRARTCGGVDVELTGGDELMLESIEYRA